MGQKALVFVERVRWDGEVRARTNLSTRECGLFDNASLLASESPPVPRPRTRTILGLCSPQRCGDRQLQRSSL